MYPFILLKLQIELCNLNSKKKARKLFYLRMGSNCFEKRFENKVNVKLYFIDNPNYYLLYKVFILERKIKPSETITITT